MKKNIIIIISLLITILFTFYGFIKANEAERNLLIAHANYEEGQRLKKEAERQAEIAVQAAADTRAAQVEAARAAQELLKCQSQ